MTTPSFFASSTGQLVILYALVAVPLLAGLIQGRAPWTRFLQWPLTSAFFAAFAGFL
jgi:hypothetical protein